MNAPGRFAKIDLETFTRVETLALPTGEDRIRTTVLTPEADYAFLGLSTVPSSIVKVDLQTFQRIDKVTLDPGEDYGHVMFLSPDGYYLYMGTWTLPGRVVKVRVGEPPFIPEEARLVGDLNNDGCTNMQDFAFLLENWGMDFGGTPLGFPDFIALLTNWGHGF